MPNLSLRLATPDDLVCLIDFTRKLISELPYSPVFDEIKIREILSKVLLGDKNENIIILVCHDDIPVGVIGCAVSHPLWSEAKIAIELLLYVTTSERNGSALRKLLEAYRFWAKKVGCEYVTYASYKNGIEMSRVRKL
jgi:hypothetical protein